MTHHQEKIRAIVWMILHYNKCARDAFNIYSDMVDAYIVYDFYMERVSHYEAMLDKELS